MLRALFFGSAVAGAIADLLCVQDGCGSGEDVEDSTLLGVRVLKVIPEKDAEPASDVPQVSKKVSWDFWPSPCDQVCVGSLGLCYPVDKVGNIGTSCGQPYEGCFQNTPTRTCALCTKAQDYCCPTWALRKCPPQDTASVVPDAKITEGEDAAEVSSGEEKVALASVDGAPHGKKSLWHFWPKPGFEPKWDFWPNPCDQVCVGHLGLCYPVDKRGNLGTSCGQPYQGCFQNTPTRTCALCTKVQGYCCPTWAIKKCPPQLK